MKAFWKNALFAYSIVMNTTPLMGINFYKWTYSEFLNLLEKKIEVKESALIVTPNPEMLYEASHDTGLLKVLQDADYALPDGAGIFVAYQMRASTLPGFLKPFALPYWCFQAVMHTDALTEKYGERITGSSLTKDLLTVADREWIPVTILDPEVHGNSVGDEAKKQSQVSMKETLQKKYPNTPISVIVRDSLPETLPENGIVFATHGNGRQEKLLSELVKKLPNAGIAIGVGGSVDLITGFRSPAPGLFGKLGLEWLYRLWKNPKKHAKRMKKVIKFIFSCL